MKTDINKKTALILAAAMALSLSACGNTEGGEKTAGIVAAAAEASDEEETETTAAAGTPAETAAETTTEITSAEPEAEDVSSEETVPDYTDTLPVDAGFYPDANDPAPVGEWAKVTIHSAESKNDEYVFMRILGTDPNGQPEVEKYNASGCIVTLAEPQYDCIRFSKVDFEVYFPEDYPAGELGIYDDVTGICARYPDDKPFEKNGTTFIGVGTLFTTTKSEGSEKPRPGDIVRRTAVYTMVDGTTDYVLKYDFTDKDGETRTACFAIK